jgi:UDP-2,3-diacylglucosamine pyrophosphatase LpxH
MLVILSDLHFCDETAMERNVHADDFRIMMNEIYDLAREYLVRDERRRQLDIVLLGDIFDLLRTERWFRDRQGQPVPLSVRPWAGAEVLDRPEHRPETLAHARAIAREIIAQNDEVLRLLRGEGLTPPPDCQVRRIYVPGNHDRLYLHDAELRRLLREALGSVDETALAHEGIHQHRLVLPRYGLLCRHGHEWDRWNFERHDGGPPSQYRDDEYLYTPIGDPITTELVARLPYELRRRLAEHPAFKDRPELDRVYARMQCIEDVRPLMACFYWITYEARRLHGRLEPAQARALRDTLSESLIDISRAFQELAYYQVWRERHDRLGRLDEADILQTVLLILSQFHWIRLEDLANLYGAADRVWSLFGSDVHADGAAQEDLSALDDRGMRHVVYGHTHEPLQTALRTGPTLDLYLNSGTWRRRQYLCGDRSGFIGWQHLSYLVFYDEQEIQGLGLHDHHGPGYERWTGTRARGQPR